MSAQVLRAFYPLSPFFKGERVRVRGGHQCGASRVGHQAGLTLPLTPTLSPLREGCQGEREMAP